MIFTSLGYGVAVVDEAKNLLWEWPRDKVYGLSVDPDTGNLYVADMHAEVLEVNRAGDIVWRYRHPKLQDLHSLTLTPEGNVLVASTVPDRVLEINKKKGIVWEWWAGDHFNVPDGEYRNYRMHFDVDIDWTHLNYAERLSNGDTVISMFRHPHRVDPLSKHGLLVRVNRDGDIVHRWGENHEFLAPHAITPYKNGFLIVDSENKRLLYAEDTIKTVIHVGVNFRSVDIKPNGNFLLGVNGHENNCPNGFILEITPQGEEVWRYEPMKGRHVYVTHYLPEWTITYTEEEQRELTHRLKVLGYLG